VDNILASPRLAEPRLWLLSLARAVRESQNAGS
jgi:hypothetical protein